MAETEAKHRRSIQSRLVRSSISEGIRAQYLAFGIVIVFLAAGVILGLSGQPISGTILGSVGLATIVLAFLKYRHYASDSSDSLPP